MSKTYLTLVHANKLLNFILACIESYKHLMLINQSSQLAPMGFLVQVPITMEGQITFLLSILLDHQ